MAIVGQGRQGQSIVRISGQFEAGDDERFKMLVSRSERAAIVLSSPGGSLVAGLGIGNHIRLRGYSTVVAPGEVCASACALAWLGGSLRFSDPSAKVGFHAAFKKTDGQPIESGMANALVGAYANGIGLSTEAVMFITAASPLDMNWLSPAAAESTGIEVAFVPTHMPAEVAVLPRASIATAPTSSPHVPTKEELDRTTGVASPEGRYFSVQVGVRMSSWEAEQLLSAFREQRRSLVGGLPGRVYKAVVNGKDIYRARFIAASRDAGITLCSRMLEQGDPCFVVRQF